MEEIENFFSHDQNETSTSNWFSSHLPPSPNQPWRCHRSKGKGNAVIKLISRTREWPA
jgi:hypothetical protein